MVPLVNVIEDVLVLQSDDPHWQNLRGLFNDIHVAIVLLAIQFLTMPSFNDVILGLGVIDIHQLTLAKQHLAENQGVSVAQSQAWIFSEVESFAIDLALSSTLSISVLVDRDSI